VLYVLGQLGMGGTERQILHLIRRLPPERYRAEVVSLTRGGALAEEFSGACAVHAFDKGVSAEPRVLASLAGLIRRLDPAVIHASSFSSNWRTALACGLAGGRRFLASVRNIGDWMGPLRRRVERTVVDRAAAVIVNAQAIKTFMIEHVGARPERIRVIPNGVELDRFRPRREGDPDLRRELLGSNGSLLVGSVMSLSAKKNPGVLVAAAADVARRMPGVRFVLAGEGSLRGEIERQAGSLGLGERFRLLGLRDDVPELLRALDILVLPSGREGLPNVVLEAMACGVPVVATAVGGTPELVVEGRTGSLVPPGDASRLASAIMEMASDPERLRSLGAAAAEHVRSAYGMDAMVSRTIQLYDEVGGARR